MKTKAANARGGAEPGKKGRIICATDFSIHAAQAGSAAAAIARRLHIPLLLVHVLDITPFSKETEPFLGQIRESRRKRLLKEAARLRAAAGNVSIELIEGKPEVELIRMAQKPDSRLLVMASIGDVAVSRLVVGSVAERTAQRSPIPTLVVRDEKPFLSWSEGKRSLNVFIALDSTASSDAALCWIKELRRIGPCALTAGSVDWPPETRNRLGLAGVPPFTRNTPEVQRTLERDLRQKIKRLLGDTSAEVLVEGAWGPPELTLIEMARRKQADLFLVGTHQHHGWARLLTSSVSREVLHHAPMSVACVPSSHSIASMPIPEYFRVLVTTDFSDLANQAIPSAYSVLTHGGVVRLVHVLPPFEWPNPILGPPRKSFSKRQYQKYLKELSVKLQNMVPEEAAARGITTEVAVIQGRDAALTISQEAERFGADLLCLGSHGRSGLAATVLGSVAQRVISRSRKPVLIVRPPPP